jgi:1-deoxy-D-xylulose-5-phosphate reductoisomerase
MSVVRRKRVAVLGSTGSIGRATLDVISRMPDRFEVHALAAHSSTRGLLAQTRRYEPAVAVFADWSAYERARKAGRFETELAWGLNSLIDVAASPAVDIVVMAMSGTMGVLPVIAALEKGKRVAIATKEILVGFGQHVMSCARRSAGELLPIDSELSALFQCLDGRDTDSVKRVILTASGGPFWRKGIPARATVSQVLRHPTWNMGDKITVDSATMMNKGLEVIEAHHLFSMPEDRIEVLVHPQSVIHSMVMYVDGSVLAQLGTPDMRTPIAYSLAWPERMATPSERLDLGQIARLTFEAPDPERFPALRLAREALKAGGNAPTILSAANEIAVEHFLAGGIGFLDIAEAVEETLNAIPNVGLDSLDDVYRFDAEARRVALEIVKKRS